MQQWQEQCLPHDGAGRLVCVRAERLVCVRAERLVCVRAKTLMCCLSCCTHAVQLAIFTK